MNIQSFLDSGIIEDYILGVASPQDVAKIEELASESEEVVQVIEETKNRLLDYILLYDAEEVKLSLKERMMPYQKYIRIAAVLFLGVSLILNFYFYIAWQNSHKQVQSLLHENTEIHTQLAQRRQYIQNVRQSFATLNHQHNQVFTLAGVGDYKKSSAKIYWNSHNKEVFLCNNMPAPPKDKQYQLWYVQNDKVYDAGLVSLDNQKMYSKMKTIQEADAFVLTLEKKGGVAVSEGLTCALGNIPTCETRQ